MKRILLVVLLTGLSPLAKAESIGMVSLPLTEFEKLAARERSTHPPVADYAITRSVWKLAAEPEQISGQVLFEITVFSESSCFVPLVPAGAILQDFVAPELAVLMKNGQLGVLSNGPGTYRVNLQLALRGRVEESGWVSDLMLPGPVVTVVEITENPSGLRIEIPEAMQADCGAFFPPSGKPWKLILKTDEPEETPSALPPVVTIASAETRCANDGASLSTVRFVVRYQEAFDFSVNLPAESAIIGCQVDGRPAQPKQTDGAVVVRLPETQDETTVELSYTEKIAAFQPVRGSFEMDLPRVPWLIERWDWQLTLPQAYTPVALEGNVELQSGGSSNVIPLRKEITHGEAPLVRVFYEKPETK